MTATLKDRKGFTLTELLASIGIISSLAAILIPALGKARDSANRIACASNLRQIGIAMQMYKDENKNRYPQDFSYPTIWNGQWNYLSHQIDGWGPVGLGNLVESKKLAEPGVFFCTDASMMREDGEYGLKNWGKENYSVSIPYLPRRLPWTEYSYGFQEGKDYSKDQFSWLGCDNVKAILAQQYGTNTCHKAKGSNFLNRDGSVVWKKLTEKDLINIYNAGWEGLFEFADKN